MSLFRLFPHITYFTVSSLTPKQINFLHRDNNVPQTHPHDIENLISKQRQVQRPLVSLTPYTQLSHKPWSARNPHRSLSFTTKNPAAPQNKSNQ